MVTRISKHRPLPPLKPSSGVGTKPRGPAPSGPQQSNRKHLHQLPCNQRLPISHQSVCSYYSNTRTISLQNSGRTRTPAQTPPTNRPPVRPLDESPVLRLSRRRRGLPPDSSPALLTRVPEDKTPSKKSRIQQIKVESDCSVDETPEQEVKRGPTVKEESVDHVVRTSGVHDEPEEDGPGQSGETSLVAQSRVHGDVKDEIKVEESSSTSIEAPELLKDRVSYTNDITQPDLSPACEASTRQEPDRRPLRNQPSVPPRTSVPRSAANAANARTTAAIRSVAHVPSTTPSYPVKHTKGIRTSSGNATGSSPAGRYSPHNSRGAAKDSSKLPAAEDWMEDSSCLRTSKGSTKCLSQTKSSTSVIRTRTSPRTLLKR